MGINVSLVYLRRYDVTLNWLLSSTLTCVQRRPVDVTWSKLQSEEFDNLSRVVRIRCSAEQQGSVVCLNREKIILSNCSSKICSFDIHKVKHISWCEKRSEPLPWAFRLRCSTVKAITACDLLYSLKIKNLPTTLGAEPKKPICCCICGAILNQRGVRSGILLLCSEHDLRWVHVLLVFLVQC